MSQQQNKSKTHKGKLLGLDIGTKKTGIAITDVTQCVVFPRTTVNHKKFSTLIDELRKLCKEEGIEKIIIGMPLDDENRKRRISYFVEEKTEQIRDELGVEVAFTDEAYSSQEADDKMNFKKDKADRDMLAATIILERYLREQG
jgi:putative holliday junction resolvase